MVILKHNAVSVILLHLRKSSCLHICIDCNFYCACKNRYILGFFYSWLKWEYLKKQVYSW